MLKYWIVVKDAVVTSVHSSSENLFLNTNYDNTYNWFIADFPPQAEEEIYVTEVAPAYSDSNDENEVQVPTFVEYAAEKTVAKSSIADPRITMLLADAKAAVKTMIEARFEHEILATYPLQTQQTITQLGVKPGGGNYTSSDVTTMNNFINGKLTARNTKNAEVDALTTNAAVIAYGVRA